MVSRPKGKSIVSSKNNFRTNNSADGSIEKFKEIFFAQGFSQKKGIDYEEFFAPLARYTSMRTIFVLVAKMKWNLHQMEVTTSFLNGVIEEEVYIEKPPRFETHDEETHVCRLKKYLYGLKK